MENLKKVILVIFSGILLTYIAFQLIFSFFLTKFYNSFNEMNPQVITLSPNVILENYKQIFNQLDISLNQIVWYAVIPSAIWVFCLCLIASMSIKILFTSLKKPLDNIYGDAKWATKKEILEAGFLNNKIGVVLGALKLIDGNKLLIESSENEHVLVCAPSRTGKGVSLVIPSILIWSNSSLILDPKGELYESTAADLIRRGYQVYRLDFGTVYDRYNIFADLKKGDEKLFKEVTEIINILLEAAQIKGDNVVFTRNAVTLLRAIILYMIEQEEVITLSQLSYMVSGLNIKTGEMFQIKDLLEKMKKSKNPQIAADANRLFEDANIQNPKTFRAFLTDIEKNLAIFKDNILASITNSSDFSVYDMLDIKKPPTALFLTIPSADAITGSMDTVAKLFLHHILVNALYKTGRRERDKYGDWNKRVILCLFDEFPSIGKFEPMEKLLADAGGYGAKFYLIAQDIHQINRYYGENNSIFAATTHKVFFTPNDMKTAEQISNNLGAYTIVEKQTSVNAQVSGVGSRRSKSINESYIRTKKELLSPNKVLNLPPTDSIIMTKNLKYKFNIYGKKYTFFENKEFLEKVNFSKDKAQKRMS